MTPEPPRETSSGPSAIINNTKKGTKKKNGIKKNKQVPPPPRPRQSLVRKRPVSFGNPALGTYHGCLYTLDVAGEDYCPTNRPLIEGAESVERIVAMVDVPPDQVPEGILNLARSHRPYLYHVRIVIAENDEEFQVESSTDQKLAEEVTQLSLGEEETKDSVESTGIELDLPSESTLLSTEGSALDIAASDAKNASGNGKRHEKKADEKNVFDVPCRTYLVLLELCSIDAAEAFVDDLHDKPYTSFDLSQRCSVHHVLAVTGEDGVSLLSPFFAPAAKSASPKGSGLKGPVLTANTVAPIVAASVTDGAIESAATTSAATTSPILQSTPTPIAEDYNCAVCLEHMVLNSEHDESDASKQRSSILTTVCNHSFHMDCLLKWQDSPCPVCRYDHSGLNEALSQCHICGSTENNYVCLICGVVSCGGPPIRRSTVVASHSTGSDGIRTQSSGCGAKPSTAVPLGDTSDSSPSVNSYTLSQSHARKHYDQTLHAYALDTETQHVWDFAGQGYVHRLLQNKEDGKLVEFHNPSSTSHERSLQPGLSDTQEGEVVHRKLEGYASQYYTLLKSQLEQQRIYYEGRLEELRRESVVRKRAQTIDLINALKQERAQLSKRVSSLKERHCKIVGDAAFLKNMNESLEANKAPLKQKIKEAQRQRREARDQIEQCLPVLEEKVTALLQELTGETESGSGAAAANGETNQHLGDSDAAVNDDRKPKAK